MIQVFTLSPFQDDRIPSNDWTDLALQVEVQRTNFCLYISYQLQGDLSDIVLPNTSPTPSRKDNLWETTCFEFFLGPKGAAAYWEVNLSPNNDWNIYHFDEYRTGMKEAQEFHSLPYQTETSPSNFSLECSFPLRPIAMETMPLELSVTAVLAKKSNAISYWAIHHAAEQADFHQRESFVAQV